MRLDPVYLLAPEPEPPKVTRRAAILACLGAAASGMALGFGGGYLARPTRSPERADGVDLEDEQLRWALRLQEASDEELVGGHETFLLLFDARPRWRELLEPGVLRLCDIVIESRSIEDSTRSTLRTLLLRTVFQPAASDRLRARAGELRRSAR